MSNLSVNNFPRLNNDLHSPVTDTPKPVANTASDSPSSTDSNLLKNGTTVAKDGTVTFNKDALEKLFEMFEFAFKAIRNMLSGQGGLPRPMPDAAPQSNKSEQSGDALAKVKADSNPAVPTPATNIKPDVKPAVQDLAPKVQADSNPAVPTSATNIKPDVKPAVQDLAPKVQADSNPAVPTPATNIKPDVKPAVQDLAPKVQADSNPAVPTPATNVKPGVNPVVPAPRLNVAPETNALSTRHRIDPGFRPDAFPDNRVTTNVTVQVMNCPCPHPEVQPGSQDRRPVKPGVDDQAPVVPDRPVTPVVDDKTPIAPQPPVTPDVTAPGPAEDDFSELSGNSRKQASNNDWRFNPGRRISR